MTLPSKVEQKFQPYSYNNFEVSKGLLNKEPSSENRFVATMQKVAYFVAAVFTAMYEVVVDGLKGLGNGAIRAANGVHSLFANKKVEELKKLEQDETVKTVVVEPEKTAPVEPEKAPEIIAIAEPTAPAEEAQGLMGPSVPTAEAAPLDPAQSQLVPFVAPFVAPKEEEKVEAPVATPAPVVVEAQPAIAEEDMIPALPEGWAKVKSYAVNNIVVFGLRKAASGLGYGLSTLNDYTFKAVWNRLPSYNAIGG